MIKYYVIPSHPKGADVEKEVVVSIYGFTLKMGHDKTCWLSIHGDKPVTSKTNHIRISKEVYNFLKSELNAIDLTVFSDKQLKRKVKDAKNTVRRHGTAGISGGKPLNLKRAFIK